MIFEMNNVHALSTLPANDGNFTSVLNNATDDEIRRAIDFMNSFGRNHKARIKACERELKRRAKIGKQ